MKNSHTLLTGWHCALPEFRHTAPRGGAFILGHQKGKFCYRATSAGLEHGAFESELLTFTPEPIALTKNVQMILS